MIPGGETLARHCASCCHPLRPAVPFCANCGQAAGQGDTLVAPIPRAPSHPPSNVIAHLNDIKSIGWLFGLLLLTCLVIGIAGRTDRSPWPSTVGIGMQTLVIGYFWARRYRDMAPLLRVPRVDRGGALAFAGLALAFFAVLTAYFALIEHAGFPIFKVTTEFRHSAWSVGSMFILISLCPAVIEECAFRGVIQTRLEGIVSVREAWLIQAALFSVLHLTPLIFPSHFLMGLCFGYVRLRSKSLYPGMLLHASWNALVICEELYRP